MLSVANRKPGKEHLPGVCNPVAIGVAKEQDVRRLGNEHTIPPRKNRGRILQAIREERHRLIEAIVVVVGEAFDPSQWLRPLGTNRVVAHLNHIHPTVGIEGHTDRVDDIRFACGQLDTQVVGQTSGLDELVGVQGVPVGRDTARDNTHPHRDGRAGGKRPHAHGRGLSRPGLVRQVDERPADQSLARSDGDDGRTIGTVAPFSRGQDRRKIAEVTVGVADKNRVLDQAVSLQTQAVLDKELTRKRRESEVWADQEGIDLGHALPFEPLEIVGADCRTDHGISDVPAWCLPHQLD